MFKSLFLTGRFFVALFAAILLLAISYWLPVVFYIAIALLVAIVVLATVEYFSLRDAAKNLDASRQVVEKLSMGDLQYVSYSIKNKGKKSVSIEFSDELPVQFQERKSLRTLLIESLSKETFEYPIIPNQRGEYHFGRMVLFLSSPKIGLVQFRKYIEADQLAKVYPSFIQMKKIALSVFSKTATMDGIRKIRTIGENDEFEHVRQYVQGDNIKSINWKATSRTRELVVNQYQDSRSQNVYCVIDKGRTMEMPFDGMSLLDYSINSALVLLNITVRKYDKAGLITFSKNLDSFLPAESKPGQIDRVVNLLYNQETDFKESGFQELYYQIRNRVSRRSIMFLYTNFESKYDLERNLSYLKLLNRRHLLIIIFFKNAAIDKLAEGHPTNIEDIYQKQIAASFMYQKENIMLELRSHGIQAIYTKPEDLSVNVVNKYLELKAKRMK